MINSRKSVLAIGMSLVVSSLLHATSPVLNTGASTPATGAVGFPANDDIVLQFNVDVINTSPAARIELYQEDGTLIESFFGTFYDSFGSEGGGLGYMNNNNIVLNPGSDLIENETYYILIPETGHDGGINPIFDGTNCIEDACNVPENIITPVTNPNVYKFTAGAVADLCPMVNGEFLVTENIDIIPPPTSSPLFNAPAPVELFASTSLNGSSLRDCINAANTYVADNSIPATVSFDNSMNITLEDTITVSGLVTIDGGESEIVLTNDINGNYDYIFTSNDSNTATYKNLTFKDYTGKAISVSGSALFEKCTFTGGKDGSAIYSPNYGYITVRDSNFTNNTTIPIDSAGSTTTSGAAIHMQSSGILTVENSLFQNNTAMYEGGAIYSPYADLNISNSTFTNNNAGLNGGAIVSSSGTLNITNSTLSQNSAHHGGAIYNNSSEITIINSTLSGNSGIMSGIPFSSPLEGTMYTPETFGGAIYVSSSSLLIENSTITLNSADQEGGIYSNDAVRAPALNQALPRQQVPLNGPVNVYNTILSANVGGDSNYVWSAGWNLLGVVDEVDSPDSTDIYNTNPLLAALADNGGKTQTHALLATSDALNAGDTVLESDQRGFGRGVGGADDIGAYEYQGVVVGSYDTSVEFTVTDANGDEIPYTTTKAEAITMADLGSEPRDSVKDRLSTNGIDIEVEGAAGFTLTLTFTTTGEETFAGYYKYGRTTMAPGREWFALDPVEQNSDGVGYAISEDGKTMVVTLKDGVLGDNDFFEGPNGTLIDPGFPEFAIGFSPFIQDYLTDQEATDTSSDLEVEEDDTVRKSTPISNTAKGLMALLFAGVAFFGFRRKEKIA